MAMMREKIFYKMVKYNVNYKTLSNFWNFLTYDYPKDAYVEIILMNIKDVRLYNIVLLFSKENPNIIIKKNCQFFINTFQDLEKIVSYKQNIFMRFSKICYSINPRFIKNNNIAGGYEYMKFIDMVFIDIESTNHNVLIEKEESYIQVFSNAVKERLKMKGLAEGVEVHSGNGRHLLYKVRKKEFNDKRKEGYKQLIIDLKELNTPLFKIDHCVNSSRCIALPETINHKGGRQVKIISNVPETPINNVFIPSKDRTKVRVKGNSISKLNNSKLPSNIRNSLEWKIITHPEVPKGDIHSILLFALKLLIREMKIIPELIEKLEIELNSVRNSNHLLNLNIGLDGKEYNKGIIISWMKKHREWCEKHNIKY